MAELERGFPEELQEVVFDVARENWARAAELPARAQAFFFDYARRQVGVGLRPGESMEDRIGTALMLMFMAGREHAQRGYRPPYPKEDSPSDELHDPLRDEMPSDLEDEIERRFNGRDE